MPKLEKDIENLLAEYGLSLTDLGYDYADREREMIFHATDQSISPSLYKTGYSAAENYNACEVVQYLCPECKVVTTVAWSVDTATDSVECECGSRAQIILPQNKRKDKLCKTQATE